MARGYTQTATYWSTPTSDGLGGNTWSAPVNVKVRWEQRKEQFKNTSGDTIVSNAVVWLLQDVDILGYLLLGQSSAADPTTVKDAYQIKEFQKIPAISGYKFERRAFL